MAATPGWKVLLVEDDADAADGMRMLLESLGHEVRVAGDGIAALRLAADAPPQAMLIDIGLPGIDGYEVARRVRADATLSDIVLIAATGYGREQDRRRALAAGFDEHLPKPVDVDVLAEALARGRRVPPADAGGDSTHG